MATLTPPELADDLVASGDDRVFDEPWQAQAFALAVDLHQRGAFTWAEWAQALGIALRDNPQGDGYYFGWVAALESICAAKGLTDTATLAARRSDWMTAYRETPHGRPVELPLAR